MSSSAVRITYRHSHLKGNGGIANDLCEIIDAAVACRDVRLHAKWYSVPGIMLMRRVQGFTVCIIEFDGKEVARGHALCSMEDQFCRKVGRKIALGRAAKKLPYQSCGRPTESTEGVA